jgi:small subunit ribosomal protein S7e
MSTKVVKRQGKVPSELEDHVAKAFTDIEKNASDIKSDLEVLHFVAAREISIPGGKKAIIIFIPLKLLSNFRKVQVRLVRELEKKFSGKHVIIIPQRKIIHKETKVNMIKRRITPRRNTLTAVNDALLNDVCYPTEIVAKRLRVRLDSSRLLKVFLDKKDQANAESKLDTFAHVYLKLTQRNVQFLFPPTQETKSFSFKKKQQVKQPRSTKYGVATKRLTKAVKTGRFVSRAKKIQLRKAAARKVASKRMTDLQKARTTKKADNIKKAAELKKLAEKKRSQRKNAENERQAKIKVALAAKATRAIDAEKLAKAAKSARAARAAKVAQVRAGKGTKAAKSAKPAKAAQPKQAKSAEPAAKQAKAAQPKQAKAAQPAAKQAKGAQPKQTKAAQPKTGKK